MSYRSLLCARLSGFYYLPSVSVQGVLREYSTPFVFNGLSKLFGYVMHEIVLMS